MSYLILLLFYSNKVEHCATNIAKIERNMFEKVWPIINFLNFNLYMRFCVVRHVIFVLFSIESDPSVAYTNSVS